jgi:hypothetical protein
MQAAGLMSGRRRCCRRAKGAATREQYCLRAAWRRKVPLNARNTVMCTPRAAARPMLPPGSAKAARPPSCQMRTLWPGTLLAIDTHRRHYFCLTAPRTVYLQAQRHVRALTVPSFAAVRAAISAYCSMPPASVLSCPLTNRKTVPGATPVASPSESLLSPASSSSPRTPGASLCGDAPSTTVLILRQHCARVRHCARIILTA